MDTKRTRSAGGIVLGDGGTIALVQAKGGNGAWLFPKGHVEAGEDDETAARREIQEETGLTGLEYLDDLGGFERYAIDPMGAYRPDELKEIRMFLFAAPARAPLDPEMKEEIGAARWVPFAEMVATIGNDKECAWFASVAERVRKAIPGD